MLVTFGKLASVRVVQPEKALFPMLVTPAGISTLVKLLHPLKARFPMLVTPARIVTCFIWDRQESQGAAESSA